MSALEDLRICLRNVYSHCTTRSDEQDWPDGVGRERTRRRDIIVLTTHLYQEPPSPVPNPLQLVRTRLLYSAFMLLLMFGSWEWTRGQLETNVGQPVIGNIQKRTDSYCWTAKNVRYPKRC